MKIAIIIPSLLPKGPIRIARDVAHYLLLHKHDVVVYYMDTKEDLLDVRLKFDCPCKKLSIKTFWELRDYDVLHSHMLRPDIFLFLFGFFLKGEKITTIHNFDEMDLKNTHGQLMASIFSPLWRFVNATKDVMIVLNHEMKKYYSSSFFLKKTKIEIVFNGVSQSKPEHFFNPHDTYQKIISLKNNNKTIKIIGSCGIVTDRKGFHQIIYALKKLQNFYFILIGDGEKLTSLKNMAEHEGVSERCFFLGYVDERDKMSYFELFDLYVLSSYSEGMPSVLLEAVSWKVPVVASDINVHKELFAPEEISFFKLDDIDDLIEQIKKTIENGKNKTDKAFKKYIENYTVEKMGENYLKLYKKILECPKKNTL
ncbi:MAG: glycosyltransferase family 4 protein [Chitinophagaceae bacterium]|nr:glycosyltransferase family 4 protein [Chitinophagaceae bacterium]